MSIHRSKDVLRRVKSRYLSKEEKSEDLLQSLVQSGSKYSAEERRMTVMQVQGALIDTSLSGYIFMEGFQLNQENALARESSVLDLSHF